MTRSLKRRRHELIAPRVGTNRYFAYARVSTKDQKERDLSLPAQWAAIHNHASRTGLEIVHQFEEVESARQPGRHAFMEMMEALRKDGHITGVVCHKLDRLLRNFKDFVLVEDLIQAGVDFQFVTGNYDRSPVGKLGLGIQVLFAKHYIDNLSEEVKKGMHQRMFVQRRWASRPPLGYSFQGFEKDAEIVPDPERFPVLKKGWELLLSGRYSLDALANELFRRGLRTRGDRRFPAGAKVKKNTLYDIFTNPFYYGIMRIKGELVPGSYEPMITKAMFDRCQDILHGRGHPRPVRRKEFAYGGFLVCGTCGAAR